MKKTKTGSAVKTALAIFLSMAVFFGGGYAYLKSELEKSRKEASKNEQSVPYQALPEDAGIMFCFPDENNLLVYLEFSSGSISAVFCDGEVKGNEYCGYSIDYELDCDYAFIEKAVDACGGVELNRDGETLRYTGGQIVDILSLENETQSVRKDILKGVLKGFSSNGIEKKDLLSLVQSSSGTLGMPECLIWIEYLPDMLENVSIVK